MMKQQNLNSNLWVETIATKFGNVSTMVLDLYAIRTVFKEQESLTVWISDDDNKLPIGMPACSRIHKSRYRSL
jgi:hypothetical protein